MKKQIISKLGKNIKKYRKEKNLTQNSFALSAGLTQTGLKHIELTGSCTLKSLLKIYSIIGGSIYELFDIRELKKK